VARIAVSGVLRDIKFSTGASERLMGDAVLHSLDGSSPDQASALEACATQPMHAKKHQAGTRKPCHYVATRGSCSKSLECGFCHEHRVAKYRPTKAKREYCKRIAEELDHLKVSDPSLFEHRVHELLAGSAYMQAVVWSKLKNMDLNEKGFINSRLGA
jgi:hypothetical protein